MNGLVNNILKMCIVTLGKYFFFSSFLFFDIIIIIIVINDITSNSN